MLLKAETEGKKRENNFLNKLHQRLETNLKKKNRNKTVIFLHETIREELARDPYFIQWLSRKLN